MELAQLFLRLQGLAALVSGGRFTTDPNDPRLGHGSDEEPARLNEAYLVLSEEERAKGYVRPVRTAYVHSELLGGCGAVTHMAQALAETYAAKPHFYGATYCVGCRRHRPVGENGEFFWLDTVMTGPYAPAGSSIDSKVGT